MSTCEFRADSACSSQAAWRYPASGGGHCYLCEVHARPFHEYGEYISLERVADRPIVRALRKMLSEMDDGTPILREWRLAVEVAIKVIQEEAHR